MEILTVNPYIWVNIAYNVLLPDGIQGMNWTNVLSSSEKSFGIHIRTISQRLLINLIRNVGWEEVTFLKSLLWNLAVTTTSITKFITCDLFSNVF